MADHLGDWWCRYCHYKAKSLFLWQKHLKNFHEGSDPRGYTHIEPADHSVVCFVCKAAETRRITVCPDTAALVQHIEAIHYRSLEECEMPLEWFERIGAGFTRWLAFHRYLKEAGRD